MVNQPSEKVRRYIEESGLPFNILVDESREVVKTYGIWHRIGLDAWNIARPSLFVIDRTGIIRAIFVADQQEEFPTHEEIASALTHAERSA